MLLGLECDAVVLAPSFTSTKHYHSSMMLAYIEPILVGILPEADDLFLELLVSYSRYQSM